MRYLSIKQPWAWAVVTGIKTIENRQKSTSYRGPLLIHSSKILDKNVGVVFPDGSKVPPVEELQFGAYNRRVNILSTIDMDDEESNIYKSGDKFLIKFGFEEALTSPFGSSRWRWVFMDAIEFKKPIQMSGNVGIQRVSQSVIERINQKDIASLEKLDRKFTNHMNKKRVSK